MPIKRGNKFFLLHSGEALIPFRWLHTVCGARYANHGAATCSLAPRIAWSQRVLNKIIKFLNHKSKIIEMPKKFLKKLFLAVLTVQLFGWMFFGAPKITQADDFQWTLPDIKINISGNQKIAQFTQPKPCPDEPDKMCINWVAEYIAGIYKYAIGVVGILAAVVLMIGGLIWLTAGGNQTRIGEAKSYIGASLTGLVIALSSYLILYQINPELVNLRPIKVTQVKELPASQQLSLTELKCSWTAIPLILVGASNPCAAARGQSWWYDGGASKCEGKNPGIRYLCCCPSCDNCADAKQIGLSCKETSCSVNQNLLVKLKTAYSINNTWTITEAWPPIVNHLDPCHQKGTCVDLDISGEEVSKIKAVYDALTASGLKAVYEIKNCAPYTSAGINCKMYTTTTGSSFHVEL